MRGKVHKLSLSALRSENLVKGGRPVTRLPLTRPHHCLMAPRASSPVPLKCRRANPVLSWSPSACSGGTTSTVALILGWQRDLRFQTHRSRRWRGCISGLVRAFASHSQLSVTTLSAEAIAAGQCGWLACLRGPGRRWARCRQGQLRRNEPCNLRDPESQWPHWAGRISCRRTSWKRHAVRSTRWAR